MATTYLPPLLPETGNLTAGDLEAFMRSRKSPDCKIAADWIADHPDHPDVAPAGGCIGRLERFVGNLEVFLVPHVQARVAQFGLPAWCRGWWAQIARRVALAFVADRFRPPPGRAGPTRGNAAWQPGGYHWDDLAHIGRNYFAVYSPAWASVLVRRLRLLHVTGAA